MNIQDCLQNADKLFPLPDTALRLQELLNDDKSSLDDISEVVTIDPALTSKLLKIANSSFYNFASSIDTVSRAIGLVGSDAVYNLALANSAVDAFSKVPKDTVDLDAFWQLSVDCALICKELGAASQYKNLERLFVVGLLHNIGTLICASEMPELTRECQASESDTLTPWQAQEKIFSFTFAELGAELMRLWKLPPEIYNVVANQHTPEKSSFPFESQLLNVASRAAISMNQPEKYPLEKLLNEEVLVNAKLTEIELNQAIEIANIEAINVLSILNPSSASIY